MRGRTVGLAIGMTMIELMAFGKSAMAWDSGPAIALRGSPSSQSVQPSGTVVFGRNGETLTFVSSDGVNWLKNFGDQIWVQTGHIDSDPAATYVSDGGLVWCAHRSGTTTAMICGHGTLQSGGGLPNNYIVINHVGAVGSGTFDSGISPAVVAIGTDVYVFGQGQDLQIWYSKIDARTNGTFTNDGWHPIPAPADGVGGVGTTFWGSPAAVKTDANGGILEVCARKMGGAYLCSTYSPSTGFSAWSVAGMPWNILGSGPASSGKPALARNSSATFMFAVNDFSPVNALFTFSTDGLTSWSNPVGAIPYGTGFLTGRNIGLAAASVSTATTVVVVGRGSDGNFWLSYGAATTFGTGWFPVVGS